MEISVIIVHYGPVSLSHAVLQSIKRQTIRSEIILINNNAITQFSLPNVTEIIPDRNIGYAAAINMGIKAACGSYFMILNNDVVLPEDFLEHMLRSYKTSKYAGISPIMKEEEDVIYSGYTHLHPFTGRNAPIKYKGLGNHFETAYLHGAAMLFSAEHFQTIGEFDESYFLYYEEVDWCQRGINLGELFGVISDIEIIHNESSSVQKESYLKTFYLTRNRIYFMRKHHPTTFNIFTLYIILLVCPLRFMYLIATDNFTTLRAILDGILAEYKLNTRTSG